MPSRRVPSHGPSAALVILWVGITAVAGCGRGAPAGAGAPVFAAPPDAVALAVRVEFTGTQVVVGNAGEGLWTRVRIEVARGAADGPYLYEADGILAGRSVAVGALNFARRDGARLSPFAGPPREWAVTAVLPDGRAGFATGTFE